MDVGLDSVTTTGAGADRGSGVPSIMVVFCGMGLREPRLEERVDIVADDWDGGLVSIESAAGVGDGSVKLG